jgi:hypothetical protein
MGLTTGAAEAADPRYREYFKTDLFNGIGHERPFGPER